MTILKDKTQELYTRNPNCRSAKEHKLFMNAPQGVDNGLRMMVEGIEEYCRATLADNDWMPGEDYVLEPELTSILNSLNGMLSHSGNFDGGTLSSTLLAISKEYNLGMEQ